jgi:hypothetical protein
MHWDRAAAGSPHNKPANSALYFDKSTTASPNRPQKRHLSPQRPNNEELVNKL